MCVNQLEIFLVLEDAKLIIMLFIHGKLVVVFQNKTVVCVFTRDMKCFKRNREIYVHKRTTLVRDKVLNPYPGTR